MKRLPLLILFFLSGISGLIYQIAWVRQASLTFGVSVYAYSTVLTAYMGGLALGSYWFGKRIDQAKKPLRTYAYLEVGIALLAVIVSFMLLGLNGIYASINRALNPSLPLLTAIRLSLSILTLAPATILIGATLPVMSRIYAARAGKVGGDVGRLFSINTAGAVLGCLATALFLMRLFGLRETIFIGAGINLLVAAIAWWLNRSWQSATTIANSTSDLTANQRRSPRNLVTTKPLTKPMLTYLIVGYACSGFAALGYEIIWARILSIHSIHAVYSFALMLAVYLTGLAVGGLIGLWWLGRQRATFFHFGLLQLLIGLVSIITLYVLARLPAFAIEDVMGGYTITREILFELFLAFITVFPPTVLIGATFPIVSSLYTHERNQQVGLHIGTVSALNTVGAILGSLGTGFLLIPWLGLRNAALALAGINLVVGMGAMWLLQKEKPQLQWITPVTISLAAIATFLLPPGLYLGFREGPSEHLVFYEEGVETTVAIFEVETEETNFKVSFVNGRNEVPTDQASMAAFRLLGHLPAILQPNAKNALMLSFGNGIATGTLDTHNIPAIDAVDLSEEMIRAAHIYWEENYSVAKSARLTLHVEDGRNFLLQTNHQYDIITTDATHPTNASSWALFTQEFYQQVGQRLSDDGVFIQWLPIHSLLEGDYKAIIRTAQSVFPNVTLWYSGGSHSFLVITPDPLTDALLSEQLETMQGNQFVRDDLGPPEIIRRYWAMDATTLTDYVGNGSLVTDNNAFFFATNQDTEKIILFIQNTIAQRVRRN